MKKIYLIFTEDLRNYVYIMRDESEFVQGSIFEQEIDRGLCLLMGTLKDSQAPNDTIQQIRFSKESYTKEQAKTWLNTYFMDDTEKEIIENPSKIEITKSNDIITVSIFKAKMKKNFYLHSINGVEVFASGKWNGDHYTNEDLDEMVKAFNDTGHKIKPFLKLGHNDEQKLLATDGLPSAGWVSNLRRIGDKLVADFVDIPKKIFELISNKAFRKVSSEIFWNVEVAGQKYKRMLTAVALLGADLPAVSTLDDILAYYKFQNYDDHKSYQFKIKGVYSMDDEKVKELEAKNKEMEAQLKKYESDLKSQGSRFEEIEKQLQSSKEKLIDAEVEKSCVDLEKEGLVEKSMKPFVYQLLREDKKTYKVNEKDYSKFEALKEILKLSKETSKVNFTEGSEGGKKDDSEDAELKKVETMAKEKGISFEKAYRLINKN